MTTDLIRDALQQQPWESRLRRRKRYRRSLLALALWLALSPPAAAAAQSSEDATPPRIVFFGDSLTAGYGLPAEQAFPALIRQRIEARGWRCEVVAAGVPGETSAGGLRRIEWLLRRPVAVLVLELGGNDALRGLPPARTRENLQGIIDRTRESYPEADIVIAGMLAPPNLGPGYTAEFAAVYRDLAEENAAALIPFLLEGVAAVPELGLGDGIHPNAAGHERIADSVWAVLEPLLARVCGSYQ